MTLWDCKVYGYKIIQLYSFLEAFRYIGDEQYHLVQEGANGEALVIQRKTNEISLISELDSCYGHKWNDDSPIHRGRC